jgi:hypothetical protein
VERQSFGRPADLKAAHVSELLWSLADSEALQTALLNTERTAEAYRTTYCVASRLPSRAAKSAPPANLQLLTEYIAAIQMSFGRRLGTIYQDAVHALGRRRLHLGALALRAYVELGGALSLYESRLSRMLVKGIVDQPSLDDLMKVIREAVGGGRFDWAPFFEGGAAADELLKRYADASSVEKEPTQEIRQRSVATFVSHLDERFAEDHPRHSGRIRVLYAMLSDIGHPAFGGDLFFAEVPQEPGWITHRAEPHDDVVRDFVRRIALPVLLDVATLVATELKRLGSLADSLRSEPSGPSR